jgi:hypothetical protein
VEPVGYRYLASVASSVLAAYVAASATGRSDQRRTWTRPAATGLYVELLTAAMASLLHTLGAFLAAIVDGGRAAVVLVAASGSVALVGWLGPVLFAHSDIACRMNLVVAGSPPWRTGTWAPRQCVGPRRLSPGGGRAVSPLVWWPVPSCRRPRGSAGTERRRWCWCCRVLVLRGVLLRL